MLRRVPAKASIVITCKSRRAPRCVFKTRTRSAGAKARARLSLRGLFGDRPIAYGTVIDVTVTAPNAIGRSFKLTMRKRKVPICRTRALSPADAKATAC